MVFDVPSFPFSVSPGNAQSLGRCPMATGIRRQPAIDDLYSRQARTLDPAERKRLVIELQKVTSPIRSSRTSG
jgi:ABC-type transport system substrate-binding protein